MKIKGSKIIQIVYMLSAIATISSVVSTTISDSYSDPINQVREEVSKINQELGEIKYRVNVIENNHNSKTQENNTSTDNLKISNDTLSTESFLIPHVFAQSVIENSSNNLEKSENILQKYLMSIIFGVITVILIVMWKIVKDREEKFTEETTESLKIFFDVTGDPVTKKVSERITHDLGKGLFFGGQWYLNTPKIQNVISEQFQKLPLEEKDAMQKQLDEGIEESLGEIKIIVCPKCKASKNEGKYCRICGESYKTT